MQAMSSRRRWFVTAGVMTGMLLAALEATVVGTAMPTIVAALGGLAHYSWVFSAYLLTSTVISRGCLNIRVTSELLHGHHICPGI